ncbi:MAG TPA: malto-oligosyltrehalose synthase [Pirellulaceae bacterium]|nr:malto-oligosyltrehalose synthase [Pirellulaceae bacterium]
MATVIDSRPLQQIARQVAESLARRTRTLTATYRLQFNPKFTFRDAAKILPYLKQLGISHVYASPYFRPRHGSNDGYSVCDPNTLNPDLGGEAAYREYLDALRLHGLEQILDFVPNHMAASVENPWWFDVLENGPSSPYATFFDIDWNPVTPELVDKLLLPLLGQQYGKALEEGQLRLLVADGAFFVQYYETKLPLAPETTVVVLAHEFESLQAALTPTHADVIELQSIITALRHLPSQSTRSPQLMSERQREKEVIKHRLRELLARSAEVVAFVQRNLTTYNGVNGQPASFDLLDDLLSSQPYRLCYWRAAADEINYRRFFDVNELTALCMERPEVFWSSHQLVRRLLADGSITGLRIDHIDGLFNPEQYLWRLQWAHVADRARQLWDDSQADPAASWPIVAVELLHCCLRELSLPLPDNDDLRAVLGPDAQLPIAPLETMDSTAPHGFNRQELPLLILAEKILGIDEHLPDSWPLAGTSGYEYLNLLNGLFVAPEGWERLRKAFHKLPETDTDFEQVVRQGKLLILSTAMTTELQLLAHRLSQISEQHRRSRDFTLNMLRQLLQEVLSCFPVYRIYPGKDGVHQHDRRVVDEAIALARRRNPIMDPALFDFLRRVLLMQHPATLSAAAIEQRELFAGRFQQVTSPVMAKGVEDTAFYVYVPLVSVNEVGGHPAQPITTLERFHAENLRRQREYPQSLLATSTHDTKRSEDLRARLNVLSEMPQLWTKTVQRWQRLNRQRVHDVDGAPAPSPKDEYLFYQSLLGVWSDEEPIQELVARLQGYMEKATHEAKQRTSWIHPHQEYDEAVRNFVANTLVTSTRNKFVDDVSAFRETLADAGYWSALCQLTLKLLSPGVPDIYQGQEWWDFSLVDPDNRRPVDFATRQSGLAELLGWYAADTDESRQRLASLLRSPRDPRLKQWVTYLLLNLRRRGAGELNEYEPLTVEGAAAEQLVAFAWRNATTRKIALVAIVPRFVHALPVADPKRWAGSVVKLPELSQAHELFAQHLHRFEQGVIEIAPLLTAFPIAVLVNDPLLLKG